MGLFLLLGGTAWASGIDHPSPITTAGQFRSVLEIGISGRDVDFENKTEVDTTSRGVLYRGEYGLGDGLSLFAGAGLQGLENDSGFNGDLGQTFQGGVRLRIFRHEQTDYGLVLRYQWIQSEDEGVSGAPELDIKSTWNVYEAALGFSTRIGESRFYAGGIASFLDGEWKTTNAFGPDQRISFEAREPFGMFFGADADIFGGIVAGIEFNLIHETSVTIRLAHTLGGGGTGNH